MRTCLTRLTASAMGRDQDRQPVDLDGVSLLYPQLLAQCQARGASCPVLRPTDGRRNLLLHLHYDTTPGKFTIPGRLRPAWRHPDLTYSIGPLNDHLG